MDAIDTVSCIIGTAGHIDHGKTALVRALTGIDTDRLAEEKKRGVSIDLGFAYMDIGPGPQGKPSRVALIDMPGHERFIKNMLAGVTGIEMVLFAVAADDGVMPQTREHLDIVRLLGINKGIFAITKADIAPQKRVKEVEEEIKGLIEGTALAGSAIIEASAVTGLGIDSIKSMIGDIAGKGKEKMETGFFRLPVDRSFAIKGFGTVVTGTIASGSVKKGDDAVCFPTGARVKVRGIQSLYLTVDGACAGQRAALNISGVNHKEMQRGFVLADPVIGLNAGAVTHADCFFDIIKKKGGRPGTIKNGKLLKVHHLTGETLAAIRFAGKKEAAFGENAFGRLTLKEPMLMMRGDRFILRDPSLNETVGGGTVHLPYFSTGSMPKMGGLVAPRLGQNIMETMKGLLAQNGLGFDKKTLSLMLNIDEKELLRAIEDERSGFRPAGDFVVSIKRAEEIKREICEVLNAFHRANPMEAGIKEEVLYRAFKPRVCPGLSKEKAEGLFKETLEGLVASKGIKRESGVYAEVSHTPASDGNEKIEGAVMALFSRGFEPPGADALKALAFNKAEVDKVVAYLLRSGRIVRLKEGVFISNESINAAKVKLVEWVGAKGSIKAADFRDMLGCGRKLAIEILEYFDRERVTLRQGDIRTLR